MTYTGRKTPTGYSAGAGLTFDQFKQDATITLSYDDENGERAAGLGILDRPNVSIQTFAESAIVYKALPDGPEKTKRLPAFKERMERADIAAPRDIAIRRVGTPFVMTKTIPRR